jgi:hypothetical protein
MPLSKKKQEQLARRARMDYVKSCSYGGHISTPFGDANWDSAAAKYIETGDESLKDRFPRPRS